jgi:dienelactone hydrolase
MLRFILLLALTSLGGETLPPGQILPDVKCAADASQSYALYLPSTYSADRAWPVILAFEPGGRGRNPVDRYQLAAEQYGYIIAGSNNSRNGSSEDGKAASAMAKDVTSRFHINIQRIYTAGMSGGARVAFAVALSSFKVAGVFASSAGYPDGRPRSALPFPVFATAGTEDFNHIEMRQLDQALTTPHRLEIFEGPHEWLSSELATAAVEWMELQAMKSGLKPHDPAEIATIFKKRNAAAAAEMGDKNTFLALQGIATDFNGLADVSAIAKQAAKLGKTKAVRNALNMDADDDKRELQMLRNISTTESTLNVANLRPQALSELREQWKKLSEEAMAPNDTPGRRLARRVLSGLSAGVTTTDPDYLAIIRQYRTGRGGR